MVYVGKEVASQLPLHTESSSDTGLIHQSLSDDVDLASYAANATMGTFKSNSLNGPVYECQFDYAFQHLF